MKEILNLIEHKQVEFGQHPLYKFLRNEAVAPQKRLAFAPCFAFFVMGFGELNTCVFRDILTDDPIQDLINQHTYEDDKHWMLFLEDLEKLGIEYSLRFSKTLRYLWSKKTNFSRWTTYKLYRLAYKAHPIQKLVMIKAIEAIANIFLSSTAKAAIDLQDMSQQNYYYCGQHNCLVDSNHQMHSEEQEEFIKNIQISVKSHKNVYKIVKQVFDIFTEFSSAILEYTQTHCIDEAWKDMAILDEQTNLNPKFPIDKKYDFNPVSPTTKPLGTYLIEAGLLTPEQLTKALQDQQKNSLRLGEIIVQQGWINQQTIEYVMEKLIIPERKMVAVNLEQ
ncbi:hypothetical protein ACP6PL_14515 [Dapis sp. BLCC M126]|uniref:hypothetical protein n=1 Tax=Dapis sp. BLCC M126 TaxID=3400189 RepID=UPI003CECD892